MTNWDRRFMELAEMVGSWSKDPSTKVGAVITRGKRVISLGYNGLPIGVEDRPERLECRDVKLDMTLHAEENAILFSREPVIGLVGCTLYVTRHSCPLCAARAIQVGLSRIVYKPHADFDERWAPKLDLARVMLAEAQVRIEPLE